MKKLAAILIPLTLMASMAQAWDRRPPPPAYDDDWDYGVVIDVDRHRGRVTYEQQCQQTRRQNAGDALAGALIGGIIGHQFGNGSGQDAATALGAIAGAQAGSHRQTRCEEVPVRHDFYTVTYRFRGRIEQFDTERDDFRVGQQISVR